MTDQATPPNSAPPQANHLSAFDDRENETVSLSDGSDLDELSKADSADAPDIADRLASYLADRLEAGGPTQGAGTD